MQEMKPAELLAIRGGAEEDCRTLQKVNIVSCSLGAVTGLLGALIFGPTCVGTAIGIYVDC